MRQYFQTNPDLTVTPMEKIIIRRLPDELPPILAGLQWVWTHPTLKPRIFELLDATINAGKKDTGRPGMELWPGSCRGVGRGAAGIGRQ